MKRSSLIIITLGIITIMMVKVNLKPDSKLHLNLENLEALASDEPGLDCSYTRTTETCTLNVGAKGQVKLFGGTIITAGADGFIELSGVVVCSSGENTACTLIECKDLYETIL